MLAFARRMFHRIFRDPGRIPPGTCVDPAAFPEDDYPIYCLRCGYNLHGLPDGRCPECGDEFARGHLLVEQYVRMRLPSSHGRRRTARRFWKTAIIVLLGQVLISDLIWPRLFPGWGARRLISLSLLLFALVSALAAAALWLSTRPPYRKFSAVLNAARVRAREAASRR